MFKDVELAQYLSAKICHDLSGVLGAINSGVDFVDSESKNMRDKASELVKVSTEQAIGRLLFIRHAFGVAKSEGESDLDSLKKIANDYLKFTKVKFEFHERFFHVPGCYIPNNSSKLILCLVQYAFFSLIQGGLISISVANVNNKTIVKVSGEGPNVKIDHVKYGIIQGKITNEPISTYNVTAYYIAKLAEYLDHKISIAYNNEKVEFVLTI